MGNNHDKYFGSDKRNILVLGLPSSGKTSLVQIIVQGKEANLKVQKTKDLNIRDARLDGLNATFFDLAGGERQRIFWKQHFEGTQGIIFMVDSRSNEQSLQLSLTEINKLNKAENLPAIPIAVCLSKSDLSSQKDIQFLQKKCLESLKLSKLKLKIFTTSLNSPGRIREMITWLLKQTKPL